MKTIIKAIDDNHVWLKFYDPLTDTIYEYDIYAPASGGYVRFNGGKQLCHRLGCMGITLYWGAATPLVDLIRREYRAMRRHDKKFLSV